MQEKGPKQGNISIRTGFYSGSFIEVPVSYVFKNLSGSPLIFARQETHLSHLVREINRRQWYWLDVLSYLLPCSPFRSPQHLNPYSLQEDNEGILPGKGYVSSTECSTGKKSTFA